MVVVLVAAMAAISCHVEPSPPRPLPGPEPIPTPIPEPDPYCGDGICDEWVGESAYNCVDCGFDPLTGCPINGGHCGDGLCCGHEGMLSCWVDCGPEPYNPGDPDDTGWIDPLPEGNQ